jgi:hypothetical protein
MKMNGLTLKEQKITAFQKIHDDFKEIMKKERCRTCSCFYSDVLGHVYEKIRRFQEINSDLTVRKIQNDFENWLEVSGSFNMHG